MAKGTKRSSYERFIGKCFLIGYSKDSTCLKLPPLVSGSCLLLPLPTSISTQTMTYVLQMGWAGLSEAICRMFHVSLRYLTAGRRSPQPTYPVTKAELGTTGKRSWAKPLALLLWLCNKLRFNWPILSPTIHPGMLPLSPENATWSNDVICSLLLGSFSFLPLGSRFLCQYIFQL